MMRATLLELVIAKDNMEKVKTRGGFAACKGDGFHIWSYNAKGEPDIRVDSISEDIDEITLTVDCIRCGATVEAVGCWNNPE